MPARPRDQPTSSPRDPAPEQPADRPPGPLPVARVLLDVPLAHLDRPFDYLVPAQLSGAAVPGARVSARFAGRVVGGFVLERLGGSEHDGRLTPLRRVVSPEPVLAPEVARLARAVADRYAGTVADVLRLAVPPRRAAVEAETPGVAPPGRPAAPAPGGWSLLEEGPAYLAALTAGSAPRAVWACPPGGSWPDLLAAAVTATLAGGRGALAVVPDGRDLARLDAALTGLLGPGRHVALTAELGPTVRYRRWLAARRGVVSAVIGTRAAAFAPVADLGLVAVWDDGDDLHAEPRAPYPHVREVLLLRAHEQGTAALVGGTARTAEAAALVASGWARPLEASRLQVRRLAPRVRVTGDDAEQDRDEAARTARLPSLVWRVARDGLARGPVLVQVPRSGYVPALACARCRAQARCTPCGGGLLRDRADGAAGCSWCARPATGWRCPGCGHDGLRAAVVGVRRTAEELGRAFPGTVVRTSSGESPVDRVGREAVLVLSTPGAEPPAEGGYAAAVLLDGQAMLARASLRAGEESLRRWLGAAALVRSGPDGGQVVLAADPGAAPVQALVRWDPAGHAARELADRSALHFPPAARVVELEGHPADVADLLGVLRLPEGTELLGPVPVAAPAGPGVDEDGRPGRQERHRVLLRAPRAGGTALALAVKAAQGVRAARRAGGHVRARVDPVDLA